MTAFWGAKSNWFNTFNGTVICRTSIGHFTEVLHRMMSSPSSGRLLPILVVFIPIG